METKATNLKEKDLYNVSSETFSEKRRKLNKRYNGIRNNILVERKKALENIKSKNEYKVVKYKYKKLLTRVKYKYTLLATALHKQELYRKGVLESEIEQARKKYHLNKRTKVNFDVPTEKEKLNKKIKKLKAKYLRPVSTNYRKNRVAAYANKADISHLKVPTSSIYVKYLKTFLMIVFASVLTTMALDIFYKPFGLYNAGLRGITQILYYIIQKNDINAPTWYSHALFFGINVPLFIWSWFKIGKKFTICTFIFLVTQYFTSLIIHSSGIYDYIKPLGLTPNEIVKERLNGSLSSLYNYAVIFISAIVASIVYGIGVGFVYRAGGSTGGSKFIFTYLSARKNKSVGFFASIFGMVVIFMGLTINKLIIDGNSFLESYASATLLASLIFVFLSNYFLDLTFNKSKKTMLQLITSKCEEIQYFLDYYLMYDQSYTVKKVRRGLTGTAKSEITMILHPIEVNRFKKYFLKIDPDAYIIENDIKRVSGRFFNSWFE